MSEMITVDSTDWRRLSIECIDNAGDSVRVGERIKKPGNSFYTREIKIQITGDEMYYIRDLCNHFDSLCDDGCQFCADNPED